MNKRRFERAPRRHPGAYSVRGASLRKERLAGKEERYEKKPCMQKSAHNPWLTNRNTLCPSWPETAAYCVFVRLLVLRLQEKTRENERSKQNVKIAIRQTAPAGPRPVIPTERQRAEGSRPDLSDRNPSPVPGFFHSAPD